MLWDLGKSRVKTVGKEEEDGSGAEVLEAPYQRCQGPALLLVTVPWESVQSLRALFFAGWHCHSDTPNLVQSRFWCPGPISDALSNNLANPKEAQPCWSAPSRLATRAKAVCKSALHLLFHLNDLPSLAGLSLSRACIQGNKSYQGKNGSKKLLKSQYPF